MRKKQNYFKKTGFSKRKENIKLQNPVDSVNILEIFQAIFKSFDMQVRQQNLTYSKEQFPELLESYLKLLNY